MINLPKIFKDGLEHLKGNIEKFIPIKLKDLESLVKIGAYKMLFEEPPLPLYLFQSNKHNILGAFTRIDEYNIHPRLHKIFRDRSLWIDRDFCDALRDFWLAQIGAGYIIE